MKTLLSKIGSLSGFGIAVTGLFFLIYKNYVISKNPIVITIQLLSFCLMVWARITFKSRSFHVTATPTEGGLVTNGPYRWLRHPIYAAIIYFSWACLITFPKIDVLVAVLLVTVGLFIRMLFEEKALNKAYPEYAEYSKQAKRLIPFIF
jgi:protein-S-isoprenylcysteine O-methyltransferase Ste14